MSEYFFVMILSTVVVGLASAWSNWYVSQWNHEFSFWHGWQISFLIRNGGFVVILLVTSMLFGKGYVDRGLYESLVLTNFFIIVFALVFDLTWALLRVAHPKTTIQQGEIKDAIIQRRNS